MSCPPAIRLENVHTYYGASHILHGVEFTLPRGSTLSLMGRNGMGKTTTIRSIFGLTPPKQGRIEIFRRDIAGFAPYKIARLGLALVPEGRGIFPNLNVEENLVMAARAGHKGRMDWPLDRVLDTFPRLAERIRNLGNHLSGGEQQMLSIGRALMTNPDILILDEATEGLAPLMRKEIWSVIRKIRDTGITCVIIDKDVNQMLSLSDHCVILVKGKVVYNGTSADLAARPEIHQKHLGI